MTWETAKATIQAGVDAQSCDGGTVWVSNGTYFVSAEIMVTNNITIQSVNGPTVTTADGMDSGRIFNLGNNSCEIVGLTITKGRDYSLGNGGGIYCSGDHPAVINCIIKGNSSPNARGGGMYNGKAVHCSFEGNLAANAGGGKYSGYAENCVFTGNQTKNTGLGGGMYDGTANNCTFTRNTAYIGGGVSSLTANNCIICYNGATESNADIHNAVANYCCSPDLTHGVDGCITTKPELTSCDHIAIDSPCIGAGNEAYVSGTDIDGQPWKMPPSMGCDEPIAPLTGPIELAIANFPTRIVAGLDSICEIAVSGIASSSQLDMGDGNVLTNVLRTAYSWSNPGNFDAVRTVFNETYPTGLTVTHSFEVVTAEQAAVFVSTAGNDSNDGSSWALAKATIPAGIAAQLYTGGTVWVGDGTYAATNEIEISKDIVLQSANGAEVTFVDGQHANRCFYLQNLDCSIRGFTIMNGYKING